MEEQTLLQDLMELATHMRQERLFTQYELNNLQTLNEQVLKHRIVAGILKTIIRLIVLLLLLNVVYSYLTCCSIFLLVAKIGSL